jgi:hypothetical protein
MESSLSEHTSMVVVQPQSVLDEAKQLMSNGLHESASLITSLLLTSLQSSHSTSLWNLPASHSHVSDTGSSTLIGEAHAIFADCLNLNKEHRRAMSHYDRALQHLRLNRMEPKKPSSLEVNVRERFGQCCVDYRDLEKGKQVLEGIPDSIRNCKVNRMLASIYEEFGETKCVIVNTSVSSFCLTECHFTMCTLVSN